MGLFGFGKRMEEETKGGCSCTCGGNSCHIKVLGAGCKFCHEQHENVKKAVDSVTDLSTKLKAVANMSLDVEVEYITDMEKVMSYGVMSMPAIVVNEQVVSMGKVLKVAQVEELLKNLGC